MKKKATKTAAGKKPETAVQALEAIRSAAKKHVAKQRKCLRMKLGAAPRQGDIYIHRVPDDHPRGQPLKTRQLVNGVTTGSRHVAEAPARLYEGTKAPASCDSRTLLGPCVVSSKKRLRISHPEHAAFDLPAGVYQITYQRDARTGGQVQD